MRSVFCSLCIMCWPGQRLSQEPTFVSLTVLLCNILLDLLTKRFIRKQYAIYLLCSVTQTINNPCNGISKTKLEALFKFLTSYSSNNRGVEQDSKSYLGLQGRESKSYQHIKSIIETGTEGNEVIKIILMACEREKNLPTIKLIMLLWN